MSADGSLVGLLAPGSGDGLDLAGDQAVLRAMIEVELAWARALADTGHAPGGLPAALRSAVDGSPDGPGGWTRVDSPGAPPEGATRSFPWWPICGRRCPARRGEPSWRRGSTVV